MAEGRSGRTDLKRVLREVRIAHAERGDSIVELREAEQTRLELLAEALEGVASDIPQDDEQLLLGILPGQPPRFWVDATSFVMMARDKRTYHFVKDTRSGRTVLTESASIDVIADAVTRYVAERIVERDRAIEADWLRSRARGRPQASFALPHVQTENFSIVFGVIGFGLGMIAGMFLLLAFAWVTAG